MVNISKSVEVFKRNVIKSKSVKKRLKLYHKVSFKRVKILAVFGSFA